MAEDRVLDVPTFSYDQLEAQQLERSRLAGGAPAAQRDGSRAKPATQARARGRKRSAPVSPSPTPRPVPTTRRARKTSAPAISSSNGARRPTASETRRRGSGASDDAMSVSSVAQSLLAAVDQLVGAVDHQERQIAELRETLERARRLMR
jgi:hypothetical protein